jgi:hypothetical protein
MKNAIPEPLQAADPKENQRAAGARLHCIRCTEDIECEQTMFMEFADPRRCKAIMVSTPLDSPPDSPSGLQAGILEIITAPPGFSDDARWRDGLRAWIGKTETSSPATIKIQDVQVWWRSGAAVLFVAPHRVEPLLRSLVDFSWYESELRKLEQEIAASWPELEADSPLAYEVNAGNFTRDAALGLRMQQALQRRMWHSRIEPHLLLPAAHLPAQGQALCERLREEAWTEDRLELLDGQIEVGEQVYEMSSQRMGEYRNSRREFILECLIVVLLATETVVMLAELCWNLQD